MGSIVHRGEGFRVRFDDLAAVQPEYDAESLAQNILDHVESEFAVADYDDGATVIRFHFGDAGI